MVIYPSQIVSGGTSAQLWVLIDVLLIEEMTIYQWI
jgi:hypothetical protein